MPSASSAATLFGLLVSSRTSVDPELAKNRSGVGVIALVVGETETKVGIDRVEPAILQRIGAQLVGEADPPAFLPKVEQHASARFTDQPKRFLQLRPAIAFERAEHVAGQALAMEPNQRRLATECADEESNVVLSVVGSTKGEDLRCRHLVERELRAGKQRDVRTQALVGQLVERDRNRIRPATRSHSAGRRPAARVNASAAFAASTDCNCEGCSGPIGARAKSCAGIGEGQRRRGVEPLLALEQHRLRGIGGIDFIRQRQGSGSLAA